ncbi:kielin/chordin-like protein [Scleropages formosus]|uniref:Kielin cysteine rich BMP regulator n=1 Tax=Scleropages formosus TaxID=113540 RepID=A0A8C9VGV3_SCLFO|nr:kielin/chordin-like protein [Scleropages formosus]
MRAVDVLHFFAEPELRSPWAGGKMGAALWIAASSCLALQLLCAVASARLREDARLAQEYGDESVIDLLEALNITRSIKGVTKAKGLEPGAPAWKFRHRAPHFTLPHDFSIYFLSTMQGSIGLHFVAQQAKNSDGTLISLVSPAAMKEDGRPLLRLVSSTRSNQLRLDYRAAHSMQPSSFVFPGGTPFANGRWARMALSLEAHKVSLFIDCEEAVMFQKSHGEDVLSLVLPIDLEITMASMPGDKASKFLGYLQTAEVSTTGYQRRPWRCENLSDPLPFSTLSEQLVDPVMEDTGEGDPRIHLEPQSDVAHDQPQRSPLGPPGSQGRFRAVASSEEDRLRRLEGLVEGLSSMVEMLKTQNSELQTRVQYLESCECRRPTCFWEGQQLEDGARWEMGQRSACVCVAGKVQCAVSEDCSLDGKRYHSGDRFSPDPCSSCSCENGTVQCEEVRCPQLSCLKQYIPPEECCPVCQPGCEYEDEMYENGDVFISRSNPCMNCSCANSLVKCNPVQCVAPSCSNPVQRPGQCCATCSECDLDGRPYSGSFNTADGCQSCTCGAGNLSCVDIYQCPQTCSHGVKPPFGSCCRDCSRCLFQGQVLLDGVTFADSQDPCKRCVCSEGNVLCMSVSCPALECTATETLHGKCCLQCRGCVENSVQHEHGSKWRHPQSPCTICTCLEGRVQCEIDTCHIPCRNPASPPPGSCCPVCDGCSVNGVNYLSGDRVPSADHCQECTCLRGDLHCGPVLCSVMPCRNPVQRPGECCPRCEQCEYDSQVYADGQTFASALDPCVKCHCSGGLVSCEHLDSQCPPVRCSHPARTRGQCCPSCDMCEYERRVYADGKVFNPPGSGPCLQCICKGGNVRCHQERCPQVRCSNPMIDPQLCCPVCKVCILEGMEFEEGTQWEPDSQPCSSCACINGEAVCQVSQCPPVSCSHPTRVDGLCCATCDRCTYKQRVFENGQEFADPESPCQWCTCQDGTVKCRKTQCPPVNCSSSPLAPAGQCCPQCPDCNFENRVFVDGEKFPSPVNPCQQCVCRGGLVDCQDHECQRPHCSYPLPGSCCQNNCNGCSYAGKEYPNGMEFAHPTDKCRTCHCVNGNVHCQMKRCPPLQCSEPSVTSGECCPMCPAPPADCLHAGQPYRHEQRFYDPTDECHTCVCSNGTVSCQRKPCGPVHCVHPILQDCCRTCDGCLYGDVEHSNGEAFTDPSDPCRVCTCREGTVTCELQRCPAVSCPFPVQGHCCQTCKGCSYVGKEYLNGQEFTDPREPCNLCSCVNGHVTCGRKPCYSPGCTHPITLPGSCCPVCDGCLYNSVTIADGQLFPDPRDPCSECTCWAGTVRCVKRVCPPVACRHPATGLCDCPVCDGCFFNGRPHVDGESFPGPGGVCEECVCSKGDVSCGSKRCPKATCSHPAADSCSCPVCDGCDFHGRDCRNGERFPDPKDKCQRCTCLNGGVTCVHVGCPSVLCRNPVLLPGECCPVCTGLCQYLGQTFESGTTFDSPTDSCSTCTCLNEVVTCHRKPCSQQCSHPVPSAGCCPSCDSCLYEGVTYAHTQTFSSTSDPCQRCSCVRGSVACVPVVCPPAQCPRPVTKPDQCCPECQVCLHQGVDYVDGSHWLSPADPCQECTCLRGEAKCSQVVCDVPCRDPAPVSGLCCPRCQDCLFEGVLYSNGEDFTRDSCRKCTCSGGNVHCTSIPCPSLDCVHQVTDPAMCCPRCRGCIYNGVARDEGSTWFADAMPCMSCMCVDGVTTCSEVHCVSPCLNQVHIPGECCPVCADCIYDNHVYGPGDSFHLSNDPCQVCTCEVMFNGEQHLRCYRKQCPSLVDCPKNNIIFSGPDPCCPVCAQPLSNCTTTLIGNEVHATDDPCFTCHCKDLTWTCIHQGCLPLSCPASEQFTPEGSCCPVCEECVIEGENRRVGNGETWMDSVDECITCTCNLGYIECNIEECAQITCQDGLVKMKSAGRCCYECQDPSVSCMYGGDAYLSNEHWEVDECTSCSCLSGEVHCQTERCPQVACASDETPALIPGMCCPHCIPRPATCVAFGDPHYRTFDGKMIHFQGTCTYVLTEDCEGGDFSIYATNDNRGRKGVSWTKEVTIFIGDVVVQLLQNWVVMVDYQTVDLPFLREPYIYVERKTNTVLLNTNIGVKVLWNGKSHLEVSVPGTYKNNMCGLCGNFNNYPQDDMRIRTGQIVQSEAAFGNSWKVQSKNGTRTECHDAHDVDPCKEAGYSTRKAANARCGVLKSEAFEHCHRVVPPEMFFASCVYDLCACGSNVDDCLCDSLEAYASECREAGVILQWRSPGLCAVGCPLDRGFVFDECGPPCPKTCFNKDVPLGILEAHCFKPCVPGCQCPAGLVEHESHCIAPEACPRVIYGSS